MKKILVFFLFFTLYFNVYAIDNCTSGEMNRLKELAKNVQIKYEYTLNSTNHQIEEEIIDPRYRVQILNLDNSLKIYYKSTYYSQGNLENIEDITTDYLIQGGDKLDFYIYSYTTNLCTDTMLRKITIDFPDYNLYYYENKDKCQKYPEFKYCEEFKDLKDKDFEKIDKEFDNYIKSLEINNIQNNLSKYWYLLVGFLLIIIFITVIIIFQKKKKKKDEL